MFGAAIRYFWSKHKCLTYMLVTFLVTAICLFLTDALFPPRLDRFCTLSPAVFDQNGRLLSLRLSRDEKWRLPLSVANTPRDYIAYLKAYEDKRFNWHSGVDRRAVLRALFQAMKAGRIVSGASTLTMQVVRLLEPRPRTLWSKCLECLRAWQLEWCYSKDEILGMYLTLAPFGHNIEGLAAASWLYFAKPPRALTREEITLLIGIPKSPTRLCPDVHYARALAQRKLVLARLEKERLITRNEMDKIIGVLPAVSLRIPREASSMLNSLNKSMKKDIFYTNLNHSLQISSTQTLKRFVSTQPPDVTASAIIMEHATGRVVSYVGTARGSLDMARAIRSPGSALKPFIYAMGFEQGIIHPGTQLNDRATDFHGYAPRNFLRQFQGDISAANALQQSLNVPAVAILEALHPQRFCDRLTNAGVPLKEGASLPIALGSVGVRLIDLVSLYSAFPRLGTVVKPRFLRTDPLVTHPFCDAKSARAITEILQDIDGLERAKFAYKTGTSYGHRDAWAIGYTKAYVIGVWIGKANGNPVLGLSGQKVAVPLLHELIALTRDPPYPLSRGLEICEERTPKWMQAFSSSSQKKDTQRPEILFPKHTSRMMMSSDKRITISVAPPREPLSWFLDGVPLFETPDTQVSIVIPCLGWHRISVVDSQGRTSSVLFEIVSSSIKN